MYPVRSQRPPGGGTAVTAGILGLLGGFAGVVGIGFFVYELVTDGFDSMTYYEPGWYGPYLIGQQVLAGVVVLLLLIGSIALLSRSRGGRVAVVVGSALVALSYVVNTILSTWWWGFSMPWTLIEGSTYGGIGFGYLGWFTLAAPVFSLITLILAAVPATGRWCRYRPGGPALAPHLTGPVPVAGMPYVTGALPVVGGPHATGALPIVGGPYTTGGLPSTGVPHPLAMGGGQVSPTGLPTVVSVGGVAYVRADSVGAAPAVPATGTATPPAGPASPVEPSTPAQPGPPSGPLRPTEPPPPTPEASAGVEPATSAPAEPVPQAGSVSTEPVAPAGPVPAAVVSSAELKSATPAPLPHPEPPAIPAAAANSGSADTRDDSTGARPTGGGTGTPSQDAPAADGGAVAEAPVALAKTLAADAIGTADAPVTPAKRVATGAAPVPVAATGSTTLPAPTDRAATAEPAHPAEDTGTTAAATGSAGISATGAACEPAGTEGETGSETRSVDVASPGSAVPAAAAVPVTLSKVEAESAAIASTVVGHSGVAPTVRVAPDRAAGPPGSVAGPPIPVAGPMGSVARPGGGGVAPGVPVSGGYPVVSGAYPVPGYGGPQVVGGPAQFVPPGYGAGAYRAVPVQREPLRIPVWRRAVDGLAVALVGVSLLVPWNSSLSLFGDGVWVLWRLMLLPVGVLAVLAVAAPYLGWLGSVVIPRWVSPVLVGPYSLLIVGILLADFVTGLQLLGEEGGRLSGVGPAVLPAAAVVGMVVAKVLGDPDVVVAKVLLWTAAGSAVLSGLVGIGVIAIDESSEVWSPVAGGLILLLRATVFAAVAATCAVGLQVARSTWQVVLTGLAVTALLGALTSGLTGAAQEWFATPLYTGLVFVVAAAAVLVERTWGILGDTDTRGWVAAARIWLGLAAIWTAADAVTWGLALTVSPGRNEGVAILAIALELFTAAALFAAVFTSGPPRTGGDLHRVPALILAGIGVLTLLLAALMRLANSSSGIEVARTAFPALLLVALAALTVPAPVRKTFGRLVPRPSPPSGAHPLVQPYLAGQYPATGPHPVAMPGPVLGPPPATGPHPTGGAHPVIGHQIAGPTPTSGSHPVVGKPPTSGSHPVPGPPPVAGSHPGMPLPPSG